MPDHDLSNELDRNVRRTQRAAAILAVCAALVWGAAAMATSDESAAPFVDHPSPHGSPETGESGDNSPVDPPIETVGPTEPPQPPVPVGGNGEIAPTPTTDPPSCGGLCVAPVDLFPFELEIGLVPFGIGLSNSEDGGCSAECITRAQVFQSDGTTDVDIEVQTHTPAFIAIYTDDEEPHVTDDGRPYFPGSRPVANTHGDLDTSFADTLTNLDADTEYWVIVRATDADARSSYVVGSVVTHGIGDDGTDDDNDDNDDSVVVAFAAIDIIYDGDHGRNKGELTFEWWADADHLGGNGEYERGDGSRIDLSEQDATVGVYDFADGGPTLHVRGQERDPRGSANYCSSGQIQTGSGTDEDCGFAWNSTLPYAPTMDDLAAMADCSVFGLGDLYDGWVCTRLATVQSYGGIPEFSVVVAFKLA